MINIFGKKFGVDIILDEESLWISINFFFGVFINITWHESWDCFGFEKSVFTTHLYWKHGEIGVTY